ncbi:hypothetical protein CDD80_1169 [Ophiocordyceps camponoti-rufipedis]|uniref:Uncharacterized protein n=1 Tax=Ophiocordyceps camponoti-rufipedis TaxID=2004952 RepID=A0A2C5Y321_9HYPO|nr:hypothetical protein CDD80_1169 [Ophiocordyceps camponoti-rufipedis]
MSHSHTFLRAAYVVYDWDNRNIHLAPSHDCGSRLIPIGAGPDAVPSVPGESALTSAPSSSCPGCVPWVVSTTRTHSVLNCPGSGPCGLSTELLASTAFLVPESTATWTVPRTHTCIRGESGCVPGQKVTSTFTITVRPVTTAPAPTPVPGCHDCRMPPPVPRAVPVSPAFDMSSSGPEATSAPPARVPSPPSQPPPEATGQTTAGAASRSVSLVAVAVAVLAFVSV